MSVHAPKGGVAALLAVALLAVALVACAPTSVASPTPAVSPTVAPTPVPSATAAPTSAPSQSATPIPLPTGAQLAAAGSGVVWMTLGGHLFLSGDRGATWSERALPPQPVQITTITFVDAQHGWVLSTGSPATQCQAQGAAIWRTDDGARTWKRIVDLVVGANAQPVAGISPGQCKEDLAFADATHGFFDSWDPNGRPTIYRTTDGGTSWAAARLPDPPGFTTQAGGFSLHPGPVADFGAVQLVSALGNSGTKDTTYVFRSTDGGASWTYAATTPDLSPGAVIVFLTATRWIAPLAPAPWDETADGGATWHAFTTDYSQAAPIAPQIVFGDAETGYATVRGGLQRTTDGGAHWTALKTPGT